MIDVNNTIKSAFKALAVIFIAVIFIVESEASAQGAKYALSLCGSTVIPSLLPFMVISTYIVKSDLLSFFLIKGNRICSVIFDLPPESGLIFLLSLIGGCPVGAKLIKDGISKGSLTYNQGKRMLLFCVNSGPAFIVNVVGVAMLGNKKLGLILFLCMSVTSFIIGIMSRLFKKDDCIPESVTEKSGNSLLQSVDDSVKSIISMCGWIVVFSALQFVIKDLFIPESLKPWVPVVFEVTDGCRTAAKSLPLPMVAFVLGWSGLTVHGQLMEYISFIGLKYIYFFVSRLINGALGLGVFSAVLKLFPDVVSVFSNIGKVVPVSVSVSIPAAVGMMFLFALVILDLAPKEKV